MSDHHKSCVQNGSVFIPQLIERNTVLLRCRSRRLVKRYVVNARITPIEERKSTIMSIKRRKPFEAPTPGNSSAGLVDIGSGRKMYLECHGSGTPTVVLVPGLVAAADIWSYVMDTPLPSNPATPPCIPRLAGSPGSVPTTVLE